MKKLILLIFIVGILCFVSFNLIGSEVDADGILREPFALIPIGWLLITFSVISFIISTLTDTLFKVNAGTKKT